MLLFSGQLRICRLNRPVLLTRIHFRLHTGLLVWQRVG
jgi:hypothetical protein